MLLWLIPSLVGAFGILGTLTWLGFIPVLAPIFGVVLQVFFKVIGWLLSTRIGVAFLTAIIVAVIVYPLADIRGRSDIKAEWAAADAAAESRAQARDVSIAAQATAKADAENAAIKQTSDELAQKVADYETELAKRPANGPCVLTPDDARRLRDISGQGQPKASSPNLNGLRAIGAKVPAAIH
jgi:hypothetical protein